MTISISIGAVALDCSNDQELEVNTDSLLAAARDGLIELEEAADALLELHCPLGKESGIYSQAQLDRKIRDEDERVPTADEGEVSDEVVSYLVERQIEDLIYAAGLSVIEEITYRLHIGGLGCTNLAATLGIKRQTMAQRLRRVKRKIRAAYRQGRYAGWYEVYLSEVRRGK